MDSRFFTELNLKRFGSKSNQWVIKNNILTFDMRIDDIFTNQNREIRTAPHLIKTLNFLSNPLLYDLINEFFSSEIWLECRNINELHKIEKNFLKQQLNEIDFISESDLMGIVRNLAKGGNIPSFQGIIENQKWRHYNNKDFIYLYNKNVKSANLTDQKLNELRKYLKNCYDKDQIKKNLTSMRYYR